jgi:hypothetical protein
MEMKLIQDEKNGGRWQWRYKSGTVKGYGNKRLWFDYCDAFETREEALNFGKEQE